MSSLDRFAQGLPDMQQEKQYIECDHCGGEIYRGYDYFYFEGERLCSEPCLIGATQTEIKTVGEE